MKILILFSILSLVLQICFSFISTNKLVSLSNLYIKNLNSLKNLQAKHTILQNKYFQDTSVETIKKYADDLGLFTITNIIDLLK